MSGNPDEMPEADDDSTRLRDRAGSALDRARGESTRLRDEATTAFQRRREQAQQAREAIQERREQFAGALGVAGDLVQPVQLDDRGEEFGFTPTSEGEETLAEQFADDRPFVDADDTLVSADPVEGVETLTDPSRRDEIAADARTQSAADTEFIEAQDLDAEVGPGGVESIETAPDRRDDIAERVTEQTAADAEFVEPTDLAADVGPGGVSGVEIAEGRRDAVGDRAETAAAAEDPFAEPTDFEADVTGTGVDEVALTDTGARRRTGRQFEADTPLESVDPSGDLVDRGDGFGLTPDAQQRQAARGFEDRTDTFGQGELDAGDVRNTEDGFGLARDPARELAADRLDEQTDLNVTPSDVDLEPTSGGGFEAVFEREVSR